MTGQGRRAGGLPIRMVLVIAGLVALLPGAAGARVAQTDPTKGNAPSGDAPVMLVMDTSGSMANADESGSGRIKIEGARSAMLNFVDGLPKDTILGLRTYPEGGASGCEVPVDPTVPLETRNVPEISAIIRSIAAAGETPTPAALQAAATDLETSGYKSGTLILVSDGESTCGDPCPVAQEIAATGIDLSVITIGFQISETGADELACIADATGGTYLDANDGDALDKALEDLTRPQLELSLKYDKTVVANVGVGNGAVDITATINNIGKVDATDVKAQLRFDDITTAPGVVSPRRILGNLPVGGAAIQPTWRFQTGPLLAGKTVKFSVIVRGRDLQADLVEQGQVKVVASDGTAGPMLADAERMVIMGDSYSAGEGARDYLPNENGCHRSDQTYLAEQFRIAAADIIACSGAETEEITDNKQNGFQPQLEQLAKRMEEGKPVDSVILTIGGNDAGFVPIAKACLLPWSDAKCEEEIEGGPANEYLAKMTNGLEDHLAKVYRRINDVLNSEAAVEDRGGFASIIVLAYPRIVPGSFRSNCGTFTFNGLTLASSADVRFIQQVLTKINGKVEQAVAMASASSFEGGPLPVHFVAETEEAFLPDHTVCDRDRYANALQDLKGYPAVAPLIASIVTRYIPGFVAALLGILMDNGVEIVELLHPNAKGYDAETLAIVQSSLTTDAQTFAAKLDDENAFAVGSGKTSGSPRSKTTLHSGGDPITVSASTSYPFEADGFAPFASVTVSMASTPTALRSVAADEQGRVRTVLLMGDDVEPGSHTITASGPDPDGKVRRETTAVTVEGPGPPLLWPLVLAGSLLLVLAGVVTRRLGRRAARAADAAPDPVAPVPA